MKGCPPCIEPSLAGSGVVPLLSASVPAKPSSRLLPILVLELFVLLLVLDINMRTIPSALDPKSQEARAMPARVLEREDTAQKPFLGCWRGPSNEMLIFMSDGSLITVWPASKIQPQTSVRKLTWTETNGILQYVDAAHRWSVSKDGKTMRLIPLKQDGSEESELTYILRRQ